MKHLLAAITFVAVAVPVIVMMFMATAVQAENSAHAEQAAWVHIAGGNNYICVAGPVTGGDGGYIQLLRCTQSTVDFNAGDLYVAGVGGELTPYEPDATNMDMSSKGKGKGHGKGKGKGHGKGKGRGHDKDGPDSGDDNSGDDGDGGDNGGDSGGDSGGDNGDGGDSSGGSEGNGPSGGTQGGSGGRGGDHGDWWQVEV